MIYWSGSRQQRENTRLCKLHSDHLQPRVHCFFRRRHGGFNKFLLHLFDKGEEKDKDKLSQVNISQVFTMERILLIVTANGGTTCAGPRKHKLKYT